MLMFKKLSAYRMYMLYTGASSFLFSLMFTMTAIYYVENVGANPLELVLIGTILETSCFLFEIPTGIVADIYSRRLSIIIGLVMIGVGFLLEASIPMLLVVFASQVVWGVGATFLSGAEDAWLADEVGEENLDKTYLRGSQVSQVCALLGIFASSTLGSISTTLPMMISGGLFITLSVFLIMFMPEKGFKPTSMEDKNTWEKMIHTFGSGLKSIRKSSTLIVILGIALLYGLYSEGIDRLWGAHFLADFTFPSFLGLRPAGWFGVINSMGTILSIIAVGIIKRRLERTGRMYRVWVLVGVNALMIASIFAFGLATNFGYALAAYMSLYILRRVNSPIYSAWMNRNVESGVRATVLSTFGQMDAFGQIVGGVIIGIVAKQFSIAAAIVLAAAILCPVILLYIYAARRNTCIDKAPMEIMEE
jgi:DHA3 family tetracycline resistance protein-like MFS transporter